MIPAGRARPRRTTPEVALVCRGAGSAAQLGEPCGQLLRVPPQSAEHGGVARPRRREADVVRTWERLGVDPGRVGDVGLTAAGLHDPVSYTHLRAHETRMVISYAVFFFKKNFF